MAYANNADPDQTAPKYLKKKRMQKLGKKCME